MRGLEFPGSSLRGAGVFQRRWEREMPGVFGYFFLPFFHFLAAWIRSRWDPAASAALISAFIWEPFFSWDEPGFVLSQKIWELPAVGLSR